MILSPSQGTEPPHVTFWTQSLQFPLSQPPILVLLISLLFIIVLPPVKYHLPENTVSSELCINGITLYEFFCLLFPLEILLLRVIHVVVCNPCQHCHCYITSHCMTTPKFIYPFCYWWPLGLFPLCSSSEQCCSAYSCAPILVHFCKSFSRALLLQWGLDQQQWHHLGTC